MNCQARLPNCDARTVAGPAGLLKFALQPQEAGCGRNFLTHQGLDHCNFIFNQDHRAPGTRDPDLAGDDVLSTARQSLLEDVDLALNLKAARHEEALLRQRHGGRLSGQALRHGELFTPRDFGAQPQFANFKSSKTFAHLVEFAGSVYGVNFEEQVTPGDARILGDVAAQNNAPLAGLDGLVLYWGYDTPLAARDIVKFRVGRPGGEAGYECNDDDDNERAAPAGASGHVSADFFETFV